MIVIHKIYFCFFSAAASLTALFNYLSFWHILEIILRTKGKLIRLKHHLIFVCTLLWIRSWWYTNSCLQDWFSILQLIRIEMPVLHAWPWIEWLQSLVWSPLITCCKVIRFLECPPWVSLWWLNKHSFLLIIQLAYILFLGDHNNGTNKYKYTTITLSPSFFFDGLYIKNVLNGFFFPFFLIILNYNHWKPLFISFKELLVKKSEIETKRNIFKGIEFCEEG